MNLTKPAVSVDTERSLMGDLVRCVLWIVWQCVRLPLLLLLVILEPVVSFVLTSLALLGVLTAIFWKLLGPPHFPFFLILGISIGFELALLLYYQLLRVLRL